MTILWKTAATVVLLGTLVTGCSTPKASLRTAESHARTVTSFDANWRFLKGDATDAESPAFNDARWRTLDVPHDWSIEGPFDRDNPTGGAGAWLPAGVGWYRKHFSLPASQEGRRVFIEFDGVMANSDVWINGHHLGKRPYGYVSFCYELTGHLKFGAGKTNILAVRADNSRQPASRWYAGAGIYRHVRLITTAPVHFAHWGNFVTTTAQTSTAHAPTVVKVESMVTNQSDTAREVAVQLTVVDPQGRTVATNHTATQVIGAGQSVRFHPQVSLNGPQLWDLDQPNLYRAVLEVRSGDTTVDDEAIPFGVREFEFKSDTGFWLNGRNFKIKGVCLHHDCSAFGAAVPLSAWERRLKILRSLGVNAIRTAHNPVAPEFLDLCDRMGFLVMDEFFDCWTVGKNPYDYHLYFNEWAHTDMRDTIRRDRNHPSVILYSVGNEIRDTPKEELAKRILKGLVEVCHETDPTRPVTQALFRPNVSHDYDNGLADMLDVIGTNYRDRELLQAWRDKPGRKIIGTEQGHGLDTWLDCRDHPQHAGQFLWAGIDYLGESRRWPVTSFNSGLLDRTGTPHPRGLQRESWWSDKPMVAAFRRAAPTEQTPTDPGYETIEWRRRQVLFPDWTPYNAGETHEENVEVYSNGDEAELYLNGRSLGVEAVHKDDSALNWRVNFEPGTLKVVARKNGKVVATQELHTAGAPAKIILRADRRQLSPEWDDVAYVEATVVDANGVLVPTASDLIRFAVEGPGVVTAVDSGSIVSHEPFQASERHAFQGRCFAILRATASSGKIKLTASADGLKPFTIPLRAEPAR